MVIIYSAFPKFLLPLTKVASNLRQKYDTRMWKKVLQRGLASEGRKQGSWFNQLQGQDSLAIIAHKALADYRNRGSPTGKIEIVDSLHNIYAGTSNT